MKGPLLLIVLLCAASGIRAQSTPDTLAQQQRTADDPSQFITRMELFNEYLNYPGDQTIDRTVFRSVWKVGKRFSTRLDIPLVHNSLPTATDMQHTGLGDITFRLLGYRMIESRQSALTVSMEVSLNTAASPLLGTGKNVLIPLITYSHTSLDKRTITALAGQQAFSVGGDEDRNDIYYTKLQGYLLHLWSRKTWTVLSPELYVDHMKGGASMNMLGRQTFATSPRINLWAEAGAGVFGDFITRYDWKAEVGARYFLLRSEGARRKEG